LLALALYFPVLVHSSDVSDPNSWAHITHVTKEAPAVAIQQTHSRDDCPDEQGKQDDDGAPFIPGNAQTHRQRLRNKRLVFGPVTIVQL